VGFAFGVVFLLLMILGMSLGPRGENQTASELSFEIRQYLWGRGSAFDLLAVVFAIVLGSSVVNDDIKIGTIFGVLARPVSRRDVFLGSWLGSAIVLMSLESLRLLTSIGTSIALERRIGWVTLLGMVGVVAGHLLRLALFAALGAWLSTAAATCLGLGWIVLEAVVLVPGLPIWLAYPLRAVAALLPLTKVQGDIISKSILEAMNTPGPTVEAIAYRICWTLVLLALGGMALKRRELTPRI
jgi:ABC-type transport system involved in multi-copper enzyme maturation permease subunit